MSMHSKMYQQLLWRGGQFQQVFLRPRPAQMVASRARQAAAGVWRFYSAASGQTVAERPFKGLSGQVLMVNISDSAVGKLKQLMAAENNFDLCLRVAVESGGCHGFQYILSLSSLEKLGQDDGLFTRDGAHVAIDRRSLEILRDSTIDFATELIGSQFKVNSPHASSSCGCGTSFSLDAPE